MPYSLNIGMCTHLLIDLLHRVARMVIYECEGIGAFFGLVAYEMREKIVYG